MDIYNKICKYCSKANGRLQIPYEFLQIWEPAFMNSPTWDKLQEKVPEILSPLPTKLLQVWGGTFLHQA